MTSSREACQWIVDLFTWDEDGAIEPKRNYSWETVARLSSDYAMAGLKDDLQRHTLDCDMVKHANCTRCTCNAHG